MRVTTGIEALEPLGALRSVAARRRQRVVACAVYARIATARHRDGLELAVVVVGLTASRDAITCLLALMNEVFEPGRCGLGIPEPRTPCLLSPQVWHGTLENAMSAVSYEPTSVDGDK